MKQVALTLLLICSLAAAADTLKGVVQNSTTNKPSAGDEVTLKKIGNGMEDVAKTKTNARGEFTFNVPAGAAALFRLGPASGSHLHTGWFARWRAGGGTGF